MKARMMSAVLTALMAAGAAFGGDAEFDGIVKAIESRYGTKPVHIPFLGLANFALKIARPEGTEGLKLAIFEGLKDLRTPGSGGEWRERDRFMDTLSGPNLHPMVRVHSHHDGEATYIFMGPSSKSSNSTRVLIATFQRGEATVIEVKANIEKLLKSLQEPEHAGRTLRE